VRRGKRERESDNNEKKQEICDWRRRKKGKRERSRNRRGGVREI